MSIFKRGQTVGVSVIAPNGRTLYEQAALSRRTTDIHVAGYWHVKFSRDGGRLCVHESSMVDWASVSPSDDYARQNAPSL